MQKVIVASTNPVKIETVKIGFSKMFPKEKFVFSGVTVPSGVSDQPQSEEETLKGATIRAKNAMKKVPEADYWVGVEGGLKRENGEAQAFAWIVVIHKGGKIGKGKTASFFLPKRIIDLLDQGKELGEADDIVFKRTNSKQSNGAVGILTNDVLTRTSFYEHGIILALIPFKNQDLY